MGQGFGPMPYPAAVVEQFDERSLTLDVGDPVKRSHRELFTILMAGKEVAVTETFVRRHQLND
jgi:hypothetical protein